MNNNTKNLIYFNGDSFVAGHELGDMQFLDYSDVFFPVEYDSTHEPYATYFDRNWKWVKTPKDKEQIELIKATQINHRFSTLVHAKIQSSNFDVINNATNGSCIERVKRTTIEDLLKYRKHYDKIIAVIGDTTADRLEVPSVLTENTDDWYSLIPANVMTDDYYKSNPSLSSLQDVAKFYLIEGKDIHSLTRYWQSMLAIHDFCKLNNIELLWATANNFNSFDYIKLSSMNYESLVDIMDYLNLHPNIDMSKILSYSDLKNVRCLGGHFNIEAQKVIADYIVQLLYTTGLVQK